MIKKRYVRTHNPLVPGSSPGGPTKLRIPPDTSSSSLDIPAAYFYVRFGQSRSASSSGGEYEVWPA